MKNELQDMLYERYPGIFAERFLTAQETGMVWGIACDDGWFGLIDTLCAGLQAATDSGEHPQVVATQVKEKFGWLRFRVHRATVSDYQRDMIQLAQVLSRTPCERCGACRGRLCESECERPRCPFSG